MSFKTSKYASSFSPQDLPGLVVWLDAADSRTLTMVGSNVSRWNDKVTNGTQYADSNIFTGPTLGTVNGVQALRYTSSAGSGMMYFGSSYTPKTTGFSYFFAFSPTSSTTGGARLFHAYTATDRLFMILSNSVGVITGAATATSPTTPVFDNLTIVTAFEDTSAISVILNGSLATSAPTPAATAASTITQASVGTGYTGLDRMDGFMCEILFYNRNLPLAERQLVEGYLRRKWSRTFSSNHPYAIVPPVTRPFNPLDISSCALWLDAADYSAFTLSGTSVTSWRDKSGNGCNAIGNSNTGIYSSNGFNSLPTVQFTPSNNMKVPMPSGTFPTGIAVFMVYQKTGANNTYDMGIARSQGGNARPFDSYTIDGQQTHRLIGGTGGFPSNVETTTNLWRRTTPTVLFMGIFSNTPTTWNESINGVFTTYPTSPTTYADNADGIYIGARSDFTTVMRGNISEIIAYKVSSITSQQRQQVELYLAEKWGLRSSLSTSNALRLYRALSPVFIPTLLPGCILWLDAADRNSFVFSGGSTSNIQTWLDKSTNGFHANATNNPTWSSSQARVEFNGTTQYMSNTSYALNLSQRSIFIVMEERTRNASAGVFSHIPNPSGQLDYVSATGMSIETNGGLRFFWNNGNYNSVIGNSVLLARAIYNDNMSGTSGSSFLNGSNIANSNATGGTPGTSGGYLIGQRWLGTLSLDYPLNGFLYEILVYSSPLTQAQRQQVEGYLAWKWGLVGSVSSNHLYKTIKP